MKTKNNTPKRQHYYAILKCDSLNSPAIFSDWGDCQFYVEEENNDEMAIYKIFDTLGEAVLYIEVEWEGKKPAASKTRRPQSFSSETTIPMTTTTTAAYPPLKKYKQWQALLTAPTTPTTKAAAAAAAATPPSASNESQSKTVPDISGFGKVWQHKFRLLQEFQQKYGHFLVPKTFGKRQEEDAKKFSNLHHWLHTHKNLYQSKEYPKDVPIQTFQQLDALQAIGANLDDATTSMRGNDWEQNLTVEERSNQKFQMLKNHKEETGRIMVSRKENQELHNFFTRMKKQYRLYHSFDPIFGIFSGTFPQTWIWGPTRPPRWIRPDQEIRLEGRWRSFGE